MSTTEEFVAKCDKCGRKTVVPTEVGQRCYFPQPDGQNCQGRIVAWPNMEHPVCPHCGTDPANIAEKKVTYPGGLIISVAYCGTPTCRKIFSVTPFGQMKTGGGRLIQA